MIDQLTVFLENSEGRLDALVRTLGAAGINMSALTIADTADYGLVRIICNEPERAADVLRENDFRALVTKVSAIEVPNHPGGLASLLDTLAKMGLNIEYGYCFSVNGDKAVDVLKIAGTKEAEQAAKALEEAGFKPLTQEDLL
ncbi:amino acid-binding protein [Denitrobacterium detoxificans]|uniref:Uncharacterized conserved protein, contains tandem ACT domains n=1 Tax=Denitrobacterium detoxificans TaxID=79604 RepID=A0A172RZ82_9ACTN|nr:ACT domain-containing protein [Denitrobacterium detoxificans]ANE23037.1 amino acid-binding protein [Denitrobacterium detoxificans]SEO50975.1 Uncharacterized conserved protein, contains tandem ACT domains [Denitrobacterium detoxificans]